MGDGHGEMGMGKVKGDGESVLELGAMGLVEELVSTYNGWRRIRGSECQFRYQAKNLVFIDDMALPER